MKFEFFSPNPKYFEEKQITPDVRQISPDTYGSQIEIDGLIYTVGLTRHKGTDWDISFDVEGTNAVTNKGMSSFQKVVDCIENLVTTVKDLENIETISFFASGMRAKLEDVSTLKTLLQEKYQHSPESFDGFECAIMNNIGEQFGTFTIHGKTTTETITNYNQLGLPKHSDLPLEDFLASSTKMDSLLKGRMDAQKLVDYLHIEHQVPKYKNHSNASELRANLYERTLKQRFPQYRIERDMNTIKAHLSE